MAHECPNVGDAKHLSGGAVPQQPREQGGQRAALEQEKTWEWYGVTVQIKAEAPSTARTSAETVKLLICKRSGQQQDQDPGLGGLLGKG